MKYGKAAIITPKHSAFVWTKNKQYISIPDEYSSNIKHIYLAKEFTCILNLSNDAVCIKDETDTIVHQQSQVDKIICEEKFMCYLLTDGNFKCKAFEDKYNVLIPKFPENLKMADLDIKVSKNFRYMQNSYGPYTGIYKKKKVDESAPDSNLNSYDYYEYYKIVYCIISKYSYIECFINLAIVDCKDCSYSQKIDFGQKIKATDYIIHDYSVCLRDKSSWYCYSYEIELYPSDFSLTNIIFKYEFYPLTFNKSFIDQIYNDKLTVSELPKGVQHKIPFTEFKEWKILYKADWSSHTTSKDIDKPVDGEILFVGAYKKSSDTIYMGAYGLRNEIIKRTSSNSKARYQYNNVYWYYISDKAFGFSDKRIINVKNVYDFSDEHNNDNKLSFSLYNDYGGYRAGNGISNNKSSDWVKIIYYKPKSIKSKAKDAEIVSNYTLDYASDGDSYCELGDALEISCQNFPKPISLYRDTVKLCTKKQVEEYIAYYHLKVDESSEESIKNDVNDQNYDDDIQKLNDEVGKLENQNIAIKALEKQYKELVEFKANQADYNLKIEKLSEEIIDLKNSSQKQDSIKNSDYIKELNSSLEVIKTKFSDLEKDVQKNKLTIDSKKPISENEIKKIKTELAETKENLKTDLATDADLLFDKRIKNKILSDEYLDKILEVSLDSKLINFKSKLDSFDTKVNNLQDEFNNRNSDINSKDVNQEYIDKIIELEIENKLNKYEITENTKTLRMLIYMIIVTIIILISVIIYIKIKDRKINTITKDQMYNANQQIDLKLDEESRNNYGYVNRLN